MNQPHRVATLAVPVSATDHLAGPAHARVVVLEYGDFECPTCIARRTLGQAAAGTCTRKWPLCFVISRSRTPTRTP